MRNRVEVLCRHTTKNQVIPMVVTIMGNDKKLRNYNIMNCKVIKPLGRAILPNGGKAPQFIIIYQCYIFADGNNRMVGLAYNAQTLAWHMYL